jgi:hypothetical protein
MNLSCGESSRRRIFLMFRSVPIGGAVAVLRNVGAGRTAIGMVVLMTTLAGPAGASAVTVDQIVALSKAGVSEAVILALLDRDRTIFPIEPEQIVTLKREGISDKIVVAMLRSGRDEGDAAARADASMNAANILSSLTMSAQPNPQVVVVGHGPDRPNTGAASDEVDRTIRRGPIIPPYVPYGSSRRGFASRTYRAGRHDRGYAYRGDRLLCLAQVNTAHRSSPNVPR